MNRRVFILEIFAAVLAHRVVAQPRTVAKIGVMWHATSEEEEIFAEPLRKGLADFGYIEGKDYELIETYAAEKYERFAINAEKLLESKVDLIVAVTSPAAAAAQRATANIPIVFLLVPDPVGRKFVQSLSHPGGNLTGQSTVSVDLSSKRIEFLQGLIKNIQRVALFVNAKDVALSHSVADQTRAAGIFLKVAVDVVEINGPEDLEEALSAAAQNGVRAAIFMQDPLFFNERRRIARLGIHHRIAIMGASSFMAKDGFLITYGANSTEQFRRIGAFVSKIFKGNSPGEIPVEQPTRLELSINLKTATALGLEVPSTLIVLADDIIE
ncbi:ABC transporter substrate-binding protein [Methylobacterium tarhaniae]|uniref:ABC transporter substrate-binding protein n=1 Tax=Methylobacterium tarhaniae TaxID=1187852 RepID=UPI003D031F10